MRRDLPSAASANVVTRLVEEVRALLGMQGDPLDKALTWRELKEQGFARITGGGSSGGRSPGKIDIPIPEQEEPDLTPPPTVTGLAATAAFAHVIVTWDAALYTQGHGHGQTNIYVAKRQQADPPATFADATRVWEATGALTIAAIPAELGVRWHIWAKWQTADGVESASPAGGTNGVTVTIGKIGNADLGPLIVEAANLAEQAVDLGSTTVTGTITDPARFGAMAVGYTVTQYLLAVNGVMQNLVVDGAQIGALDAAKLTAGDGTVGGILKSTNYIGGTSGWRLQPNGTAEFNNAVVRGTVYASAGSFAGDISAATGTFRGGVMNGGYSGYAWPASGQSGFYLGASGLLLGNANDGRYFQVEANGNVWAPGLTIINGALSVTSGTFNGVTVRGDVQASSLTANAVKAGTIDAGVVKTANIEGAAVSSVSSLSTPGNSISFTVTVPRDSQNFTVIAFFSGGPKTITLTGPPPEYVNMGTSTSLAPAYGTCGASSFVPFDGGMSGTFFYAEGYGSAASCNPNPTAGTYTVSATRSGCDSYTGPLSLLAIVTRR